ncbi:MAG: hypothetical protein AAGF11_40440 [Myxococcota bacterium]
MPRTIRNKALRKKTRHPNICREFDDSPLAACAKGSLEALPGRDREVFFDPQSATCSVFFDECIKHLEQDATRWDYLIVATAQDRMVVAVEVHEGTAKEIPKVVEKKQWTEDWLARECPAALPMVWRWVAPQGVSFQRGGQYAKRLAVNGIRFPERKILLGEGQPPVPQPFFLLR